MTTSEPSRDLKRNLTHEARRLESLLGKLEAPRDAMRTLDATALADAIQPLLPLIAQGETLQRERHALLRIASCSRAGSRAMTTLLEHEDPGLSQLASTVAALSGKVAQSVRSLFLLGRFQRGTVDSILGALGCAHDAHDRRAGVLLDREA